MKTLFKKSLLFAAFAFIGCAAIVPAAQAATITRVEDITEKNIVESGVQKKIIDLLQQEKTTKIMAEACFDSSGNFTNPIVQQKITPEQKKQLAWTIAQRIIQDNIHSIKLDTVRALVRADNSLATTFASYITKDNIKDINPQTITALIETDKSTAQIIAQVITEENLKKSIAIPTIILELIYADKSTATIMSKHINEDNIKDIDPKNIALLVCTDKSMATALAKHITEKNITTIPDLTIKSLTMTDPTLEKRFHRIGYRVKPLYQQVLNAYNKLSKQDLTELRNYWKSDKFASFFRNDLAVDFLIKMGNHIRNSYPDPKTKIYALGQSMSYPVLVAQLLEEINRKNGNPGDPQRYGFIAFSGNKSCDKCGNISYCPKHLFTKERYKIYKEYLERIGFFKNNQGKIVFCDVLESGRGLKTFIKTLATTYQQRYKTTNERTILNKLPTITWHLMRWFSGDSYEIYVPSNNFSYKFGTCKDNFVNRFIDVLLGDNCPGVRLVQSYYPDQWHKVDPTQFVIESNAMNYSLLRIVDYMQQNLEKYTAKQIVHKSRM